MRTISYIIAGSSLDAAISFIQHLAGVSAVITMAHINIRTERFEETIAFYETLLEFRRAISPVNPDPDQNIWLLDMSGNPCIHINALRAGEMQRSAESCLDHVAFNCADKERMIARLHLLRVPFKEVQTRVSEVVQINFFDPNGINIELTFGHEFLHPQLLNETQGRL